MAQALMSFPMGAKFHPCDEEKIQFLLYKVSGLPLPCNDFIDTYDLYGNKEPWEIFGDYDEGELYFFTTLKKIGKKTSKRKGDYTRFSRNVGSGTWTNKGQKVPVYGKKSRGIIGYKRCFRYESRVDGVDDDDNNGTWLLKEYTLPDRVVCRLKDENKNYVLCVLKRKGSGKGRRGGGVESDHDWIENELDYMLQSETNTLSYSTKTSMSDEDDDDDSIRKCCRKNSEPIYDDGECLNLQQSKVMLDLNLPPTEQVLC